MPEGRLHVGGIIALSQGWCGKGRSCLSAATPWPRAGWVLLSLPFQGVAWGRTPPPPKHSHAHCGGRLDSCSFSCLCVGRRRRQQGDAEMECGNRRLDEIEGSSMSIAARQAMLAEETTGVTAIGPVCERGTNAVE